MPIVADTDKEDSSRVQLRFSYMRINRFIPILHGHTAFLGFVCAALVGVSFWFMFSSHDHLQAFSEIDAEEKSNRIVRQFEDVMLSSGSDSIAVSSFVGSVRVLDHLAYLVISDSTGAIISAYNPVGAHRAAFQFPEMFNNTGATLNTHRFGYELASPVFRGYLYVGFERIPMNAGLKRDARLLRMAGWAMLAVAMFLMASIGRFHVLEASMSKLRKTRRELAHQKGTLESEVHSQKEKEAELKQSEERYKSLLETTMESAFKDLERQKKSLEKEVEEKTITQKTLRRTTRRLRMLNGIERKIVDEETLEDILGHAVKELQELLNADRISVLQINYDDGVVVVKSESGNRLGASNDDGHIPLDWHRPFRKGLFVARNLNKMSERFPIENHVLDRGIQSYCRVTLTAGESVAGALHVGHTDVTHFDEEYLKVIRDVADLLLIALQQHEHHLERQRHNEELIAERDRAEEMARLKTAFLTNMTHEIRTPLSGIIGFAQVLEEELDDERQEFAMHIQSAGKRLMSTINSVLDLSRLQADKAAFSMETHNAGQIVMESLRMLRPLAAKKELEFRVEVPDTMHVVLDQKGLETVVNNLVGNAIKFTETGFISVMLEPDAQDLRFTVEDSGVGISEDFVPMLFDEFRQEYMGADRPAEGSGLGLAVTSRIVEKMNGRIEVASTPGEGTTFVVVFEGAIASKATASPAAPLPRPAKQREATSSASGHSTEAPS